MNPAQAILAAAVAGVAVVLFALAGRRWLQERFIRERDWIRETHARFSPHAIDANGLEVGYYAGFASLLLVLLALIPLPTVGVAIWIGCWFLPGIIVSWLWRRRLSQIDVQIPQCVAAMANSMRAGLTLVQAVTRLSEQAPDPIRSEFKIMANQYAYGADMETVIRSAKLRLSIPNFSLFASALILNREMGGDISETLTRISKSLDKLREMRKTVEAHTSEGRTNIRILLAAPVFMLALMGLVAPHGVGLLFSTIPGWAILGVAGALSGSGIYFARRITRTEI